VLKKINTNKIIPNGGPKNIDRFNIFDSCLFRHLVVAPKYQP
jgi:hypothetical protein